MTNPIPASSRKDLQRIPGVGPAIAAKLFALGIDSVDALRGQNPEQLYQRLCQQLGNPVDRCVLYVFRCAVYFADSFAGSFANNATNNTAPDPEWLKWWHWKDRA